MTPLFRIPSNSFTAILIHSILGDRQGRSQCMLRIEKTPLEQLLSSSGREPYKAFFTHLERGTFIKGNPA